MLLRLRLNTKMLCAVLWTALLIVPGGCANADLQPVRPPADGLVLHYDLDPGAAYRGTLAIGRTMRSDLFPDGQTSWIKTNVQLKVIGADPERPGTLVRATFSNVDIDWTLGPGSAFSLNEFLHEATQIVQGMEVGFTIDASGKILYMPPAPSDAPPEIIEVITSLTEALEVALTQIPKKPLSSGTTWQESDKRGREGKLGRYRNVTETFTFEGLFRHEQRNEEVAKISAVERGIEVFTTKEGQRQTEIDGTTNTLFSTAGYPATIEGERRIFDPKQGMQFVKVSVSWEKTADGHPLPPACVPGSDVRCPKLQKAIDDPCDPDYVGYEDCVEDEAPADASSGGSETPVATSPATSATSPVEPNSAPEGRGTSSTPDEAEPSLSRQK